MFSFDRMRFRTRLIVLFLLVALIPFLIMEVFSNFYSNKIIQTKMTQLVDYSINQTTNSVNSLLASYEELSMQTVLNEDLIRNVKLCDKTNGFERAFYINAIREQLNSLIYAKDGLLVVTVITKGGHLIASDRISGSANMNIWTNSNISASTLYRLTTENNQILWTTSKYSSNYGGKAYHLFNLSRKITGFYDQVPDAVIVFSVDENIFSKMIRDDQGNQIEINALIMDETGQIVASPNKEWLGKKLNQLKVEANTTDEAALSILLAQNHNGFDDIILSIKNVGTTRFRVVNAISRSSLFFEMIQLQKVKLFIAILIIAGSFIMIYQLSFKLSKSIYVIVKGIQKVQEGDLETKIEVQDHDETAIIAEQFNQMISRVKSLIDDLKEQMIVNQIALQQQKEAEIKSLEAQINPHFLYNIFDSINWMAIEQEDLRTSNVISKLASILRYSLYKSNQLVLIEEEIHWLKQYLFLQKECLQNNFDTIIEIEDQFTKYKIYKLLMQPIIENAILHGLKGRRYDGVLEISIHEEDDSHINITISDNGRGMDSAKLESLRKIIRDKKVTDGNGIGFANIAVRLIMYYANDYRLNIDSEIGKGTIVNIIVPKII